MSDERNIAHELVSLLRSRRSSLLALVEVIREHQRGLVDANSARESAHRLAGTLGLFGYGELGEEAALIELELSVGRRCATDRLDGFVRRASAILSD